MTEPFMGSEAVAAGTIAKSALRSRYTRLFPDVYIDRTADLTPFIRARAAWLWSNRSGVVAGLTASALLGAKWADHGGPVELFHHNRNPTPEVKVHGDRLESDEVTTADRMPVTTPARTALDLACWYPLGSAVAAIDALTRATNLDVADAVGLMQRQRGRRGIQGASVALDLVDAGAQSPKETWLRLLLVHDGLPRPQTQIPVLNEFDEPIAYLDMGWRERMVAVEYDGDHHRTSRSQYSYDVRRLEMLQRRGWIVIRVTADDRPADILRRVREALARRASRQSAGDSRASRLRDTA